MSSDGDIRCMIASRRFGKIVDMNFFNTKHRCSTAKQSRAEYLSFPPTSPSTEEEGGRALMVKEHVQPSKPDLLTYCRLMDDLW